MAREPASGGERSEACFEQAARFLFIQRQAASQFEHQCFALGKEVALLPSDDGTAMHSDRLSQLLLGQVPAFAKRGKQFSKGMAFCVDNRFVHSADCLLIGMIPNQQNSRNAQVVLQGRSRCASRADPLPTAIRGDIPGQSGEAALSLRWGETFAFYRRSCTDPEVAGTATFLHT